MVLHSCLRVVFIAVLLCAPSALAQEYGNGMDPPDPIIDDLESAGATGDQYHVSFDTGSQSVHFGLVADTGWQSHSTRQTGTQTNNTPIIRPWGDLGPNYAGTTSERTGTQSQHSDDEYEPPTLLATSTGELANNTVNQAPIPSGQYSFGFPTQGGGSSGLSSQGTSSPFLPPTATSSVDLNIVDR